MPRPWTLIETATTPEGALELRQRGERDFMILHAGRVLMTSMHRASELAVARLGCGPIQQRPGARVLIGGLGLGFTLRAALDCLPAAASVTVAELNPVVVAWCRGPAAAAAGDTLGDRRARAVVSDVTTLVRAAADGGARYDSIIYDLYIGPDDTPGGRRHPLYGDAIVECAFGALTAGGTFAVWGEEPSARFEARLRRAGFEVRTERTEGGGPRHVIFIGQKPGKASRQQGVGGQGGNRRAAGQRGKRAGATGNAAGPSRKPRRRPRDR